MATFTIDIYGDTICPWCYIGQASLSTAIAQHQTLHPSDTFTLRWKPFLLYPSAKISAYTKRDSIAVRFGSGASSFMSRVSTAGAPFGLSFLWSGRTGSTRDSHKLLLLAGDLDSSSSSSSSSPAPPATVLTSNPSQKNHPADPRPESFPDETQTTEWTPPQPDGTKTRQESLLSAIFSATLTHGQDVSSRAFLVPLAVAHGLGADAAAVEAYLDSAGAAERVEREAAAARTVAGVTAVPSYVVNGRYRVGGWQEPGVWGGVFGRVRGGDSEREGGG